MRVENKELGLPHYQNFAHFLRGVAALIVVLPAHFLGVFWFNTTAVSQLLGVNNFVINAIPTWVPSLHIFTWISWGHLGV